MIGRAKRLRPNGLAPNNGLFAKIVRLIHVFARNRRKARLSFFDKRRTVFCAKPDDFFVKSFLAKGAIFHNFGVGIRQREQKISRLDINIYWGRFATGSGVGKS